MSADLANTIDLVNSTTFRDTVLAVIVEHAVAALPAQPATAEEQLAARVVYDAPSVVALFVRLAADDPGISSAGRDFAAEDVRRVVAERWSMVAAAVPNLGA